MEAVVFTEETTFELRQREVPEPGPGEVQLRVEYCGICGTDLHAAEMLQFFLVPVVPGHEFSATVSALGEGVDSFGLGDAVVVNPCGYECGECEACEAGLPNICKRLMETEMYGIAKDGGMAEYVVVPAAIVHATPAGLAPEVAAWAEPLAVAVSGVGKAAIRAGERVAVLGAGPIGQLALQVAKTFDPAAVTVIEGSPFRREVASRCGADRVAAPGEVDPAQESFEVVLDCTGSPLAFASALDLIGYGGRIVVIGTNKAPMTIPDPSTAQLKEASIRFTLSYRNSVEFPEALQMLGESKVDVGPLTTDIVPLGEHADAFAAMLDPESAIKFLLAPGRS